MAIGASLIIGPEDATILELDAAGALEINDAGISGKLELSAGEGSVAPLSSLGDGYAFDATFEMFLNTTGIVQEIELPETFDPLEVYTAVRRSAEGDVAGDARRARCPDGVDRAVGDGDLRPVAIEG